MLKAMVKDDARAILHILRDRETAWWSDDFRCKNYYEAVDFIKGGNETSDFIQYGIFRKESNTVMGYLQLIFTKSIENGNDCELGYALSKDLRRNGYMSEAVNAACDYLFKDESINRVTLRILPSNLPSLGVARKCRFCYVDEPIEKKRKRFLDDQPLDLYVRYRPAAEMNSAA